jgi:hypothetical protein
MGRLARIIMFGATAVVGCGTPAPTYSPSPPTKTMDGGMTIDTLPPVPPSPLPDARRIPEGDPR